MNVQAIIETPAGSRNKYKLDEETGRIKLSKVMPQGMIFPFDFGFFPNTKSEDGDPLDVMVLSDAATFPGCELDCRLIGVLLADQKDKGATETKRNDRLIAVADSSVLFAGIDEFSGLPSVLLKQIETFFVHYQAVRQVAVTPLGRGGPEEAWRLLRKATLSEPAR